MADGTYGYVASVYYPYFMGCFGPGSDFPIGNDECTDNIYNAGSPLPTSAPRIQQSRRRLDAATAEPTAAPSE